MDKEFNFDFDPCPPNPNFNGILEEWGKSNFINPPYETKKQNAFVEKALLESRKGKTCVLLIPARTSTKRWHKWILPFADEIRFLEGRLHFDDTSKPAPFPSAIIVFRGKESESNKKPK